MNACIHVTSFIRTDNIIQTNMFIPESCSRLLNRQMDCFLRTVMQTSIADLTVVSKYYLAFCYRGIIRRTYLDTGATMYAVIIYCIIKRHVLIYDFRSFSPERYAAALNMIQTVRIRPAHILGKYFLSLCAPITPPHFFHSFIA